jgi:hypothetical protein
VTVARVQYKLILLREFIKYTALKQSLWLLSWLLYASSPFIDPWERINLSELWAIYCLNYNSQITYNNYQVKYKSYLTSLCSPYKISMSAINFKFVAHNVKDSRRRRIINSLFTKQLIQKFRHLYHQSHLPNSNGALVIAIKLKAKYRFHAVAISFP